MDLSKLSDDDLLALKAGDLTKVSDAGLLALKGESPKEAKPKEGLLGKIGQQVGNLAAGAVRGAGSIGNTLINYRSDDEILGRAPSSYQQRAKDMDSALQGLGADTNSLAFAAGKIGTEVAGTLGTGGALANVGSRVLPAVAAKAPGLVNAIRSAGMTAGTSSPGVNALTRAAGGAITGGAATALVDPDSAGAGAALGGALPLVAQGAGKLGGAIGKAVRGPAQTPEMVAAIQQARQAGYVIPPTQAKPSLSNRVIEGVAGKITTAQNASAKNQAVTNRLAAEALGLPGDTKLTADVLTGIRQRAGQAYDALGSAGVITPGQQYAAALDDIAKPFQKAAAGFPKAKPSPVLDLVESMRSPQFDAASAVSKIKELRTAADDAFRTGNTDIGRASKAAAKALEDAIEDHLGRIGNKPALEQFKEARKLIAKTYTVEKALNPTTGTVDARKLSAQILKGKPVSGELKQAGDFAARFPKAAQTTEGMGSLPQTSPLDWVPAGALSMATQNPLMMLGVGARPAARAAALSPIVQNRLIQQPNAIQQMLGRSGAAQLGFRAAPVALAADR